MKGEVFSMSFIDPILRRIFRSKSDEQEIPAPQAQDSSAPQAAASEAPKPVSVPALKLPPEHAVFRLWELRQQQAGWLPRPELRLEMPQGAAPPEGGLDGELSRLRSAVDASADRRLRQIQSAQKDAAAEEGQEPPPPDLDASVTAFISKDSLTAWLLIYPPSGQGREVDGEILNAAVKDQGLLFGVDEKLLEELPRQPDRYFRLIPAARGQAAVNGTDGHIVELFPRSTERKASVGQNGQVDYTSLNFINNVEEGAPICKIILPTAGVPGRTVRDKELPAKDGRPAPVPKGRNTEISEDGTTLVAAISGHVEYSGRTFQVKPLMDIPGNVDFSSGNINFLGDVHIHGDIRSGFSVRATGSVTVDGVVEACTVEAGTDLLISGGVQGDSQAVIRAQKGVFAQYLENATVYAKESLRTNCIINCKVYCDGVVEVTKGPIIGGTVHAARAVNADSVGSRVETRTDVILGGQPCEDQEYELLVQESQELEKEQKKTGRKPNSPDKLSKMSKLRMQLIVNQKKLEMLEKERESEDREDFSRCRLSCGSVYPKTVLTIGTVIYRFDRKITPCEAGLFDGEIRLI